MNGLLFFYPHSQLMRMGTFMISLVSIGPCVKYTEVPKLGVINLGRLSDERRTVPTYPFHSSVRRRASLGKCLQGKDY